jgi:hypothetical protein
MSLKSGTMPSTSDEYKYDNKSEGTAWKPKTVYTWKFSCEIDRGRADEYTNPIIQLYHMRPCPTCMEGLIMMSIL